jgi:hypothetical protein
LWCLVHKKQSVINCDDEFLGNKTFSFTKQNRGLNQQEKMPCMPTDPGDLFLILACVFHIVSLPFVVWFGCSLIGTLNLDLSLWCYAYNWNKKSDHLVKYIFFGEDSQIYEWSFSVLYRFYVWFLRSHNVVSLCHAIPTLM